MNDPKFIRAYLTPPC